MPGARSSRRTRRWKNILSRELESACGLPLTWFDALAQLRMAPAQRLTMTQLASALLFSKSGLTRLVDRMVEAGLLPRPPPPGATRPPPIPLDDAGATQEPQAATRPPAATQTPLPRDTADT